VETPEQDGLLSLLAIYDYCLAIGYFGVVKGGGGCNQRFPSEFGGHGQGTLFLDFPTRTCLWFGWLAGGEDCSLEFPAALRRRLGMYGAKTGLVWGFQNSVFGLVFRHTGRLSIKCFSVRSMI
jgi:hypothetical protein